MNELLNSPQHKQVIECIESWHNEDYTQWYRIYSDGWCEQGGFIAATDVDQPDYLVTFEKQYVQIPFVTGMNLINQSVATTNWTQARFFNSIGNISVTNFRCSIGKTGNYCQGFIWKSEGYIV